MPLSSNSINLRSGTMSITITETGLSTTSFEVQSVGEMEIAMDIEQEREDINSILFELGKFSFTCFDTMDNDGSMFADIDSLDATDKIRVDVSVTLNSGRSFDDIFWFTLEDLDYSREDRTVTIECRQEYQSSAEKTLASYFLNDATGLRVFTGGNSPPYDCIEMDQFVRDTLDELNTQSTTLNRAKEWGKTNDSDMQFVLVDDAQASNYTNLELLFRLASWEGDIIGSLLGYNFIVWRNDTRGVTLSEDDAEVLDVNPGLNIYLSVGVEFDGVSPNFNQWASTDALVYNANALKTLDVRFESPNIAHVTYDGANDEFNDAGGAGVTVDNVAQDGVEAYANAYGASKARKVTIELFDIDTIKPYEAFTFDSSWPSLLQNQTFRPSSFSYNFEEDKTEIVAYRIA